MASGCGYTSLSSSPVVSTTGALALGLTHTQSSPSGAGCVPLVSTATSNPTACSAATALASSCSSGSPPVHTTNGLTSAGASPGHRLFTKAANSLAVLNLPPSGPTPTKSVSQKVHTACSRSASRPVHRLHPEKRQNTAARPAFTPSPCRV